MQTHTNYNTEYKDYRDYVAIMISTDRSIFLEKSAVRARMIEYSKLYKELHIIVFSIKNLEEESISDNCTIYSTNSFSRFHYVSRAIKIGKRIIKETDKAEKILVTCQDPFETGLVGKYLANLRKNSELLLQIHTDLFSPYFTKYSFLNKIRLFISNFTLTHAEVIRVVSKKIADSLAKKGINPEKIIIKPIDVDLEKIQNTPASFNLRQKYPQFEKIVLMVCRLEKEKNIEMAIEAFQKVVKEKPKTGLIIVGSGSQLESLKKLSYKLNIAESVIFEGWQTDTISYYKDADIFLCTSWYEGYGMVFKEAQACNLKIVSTDVGIARDVNAEIVDWKAELIANAIIKVL